MKDTKKREEGEGEGGHESHRAAVGRNPEFPEM
jgi:hypothetical protein